MVNDHKVLVGGSSPAVPVTNCILRTGRDALKRSPKDKKESAEMNGSKMLPSMPKPRTPELALAWSVSRHASLATRHFFLVVASILLTCPGAWALDPAQDVSQYAHTAWRIRDGFTKGRILAIAQTSDGYLWLGTEFGLVRFDGVKATPWQPPEDQPLPPGRIASLLAARDGTLWIGTDEGLASWKDGKLVQYTELAGHGVPALLVDREGTVWVAGIKYSPRGNGKLCAIGQGNIHCFGEDGALRDGARSLFEDSNGNLWVGVKDGLWRWKPGPPKFYSLPDQPDGIRVLGEDFDGALLVAWHGIHRFIEGKTQTYPLPRRLQKLRALGVLRDRDGSLWVGSVTGGLVHVHQRRTDVFSTADGLSGEDSATIFEDREGSIWVATINGLDRFRDFAIPTLSVSQGLSNSLVASVLAARDGRIWFGTYGGLSQLKNGQITLVRTGGTKQDGRLNGLPPESIFQDERGRTWVGTLHQFGYLENDRFVSIKGVPGGNVLAIIQDTAGNLWIANEQLGLFRLSPQSDVQRIPWVELGHKDHASVLVADPTRGGLWIGFFLGGIAYFNDGQIRRSYAAADGLGGGRVSGFQFDHDGTLWIATEGGLSRLKDGRIATLSSNSGLPCDRVHWVVEDNDGSFWLYMACGLARIMRPEINAWTAAVNGNKDKETRPAVRATLFEISDGVRVLSIPSYYSPNVAKTPDGRMWFLPFDGVSVIDPHHLAFNKLPPPVHIEQITADRKIYDPAAYSSGRIPLPARVRDLQIDYTALSLVAPEKVLFRYKLEGRDRDWHDGGNRRQVFYSDLTPRNYRFRVMACNDSGVWNEEGAFLDFSVAPAYYQTSWFRALCVAAFLGLLCALYEIRIRQLQQRFNAGMEARVNERTRIARELHDTLLQSLHGLLFRFQAARNMLPRRTEEAMEALDGAIARAEQAIGESQDAITDLRPTLADQSDLAGLLRATGEELETAGNGNGTLPSFEVIVEGERKTLSPILQSEVHRIARELLRNSFRHASARRVEAEVRYSDEQLRVRIRDDGKGMDLDVMQQGRRQGHWGLPGVKERAQQIGAHLDFWSAAGSGTEVQLTIPAAIAYKNSHDKPRFKLFRGVRVDEQRF